MNPKREFTSRWGNAIADDHQWCHMPGYILRNYSKCISIHDIKNDDGKIVVQRGQVAGVDMQDMMFVVHIMAFKYDTPDAKASPSLKTIAEYTGLSINSVRRVKQRLIDYGLLTVEQVSGKPDIYNFSGLHDQCVRLESGLCPVDGIQVYTPPKNRSTHTFRSTTPPKDRSTPLQQIGAEELAIRSEEKTVSPAGDKPASKKDRNLVFDAVAEFIFEINPREIKDDNGGRIGILTAWLTGKSEGTKRSGGKVGYISRPAEPDHVKRFAGWYKSTYPRQSLPLHLLTFVDYWRKWATSVSKPAASRQPAPITQFAEPTAEELAELAAARKAIRPDWEKVS